MSDQAGPDAAGGVLDVPYDPQGHIDALKTQLAGERRSHEMTLEQLAVARGMIEGLRREHDRLLAHCDELEAARRAWDEERTALVGALDAAGVPLPSTAVPEQNTDGAEGRR